MYNINSLFSRLIKSYDKSKKNKIKNLDSRINELNIKIEKQTKRYDENLNISEEIKKKEKELDKIYVFLITILKSRGIIFQISDENVNVHEWQNLYIKKINENYNLVNKDGNIVSKIESKYYDFISHVVKNYNYSVLVIRKDSYFIKLQLRIIQK